MRGLRPGFALATVSFGIAALAIAAAPLWPVYRSPAFLVLLATGLLAASALALAGARWRWPSAVLVLAAFAVFLAVGVPVAVPDRAIAGVLPSPQGLVDLLAGVALGWKQLLTISLPVGDYQALLVPALVLVLGIGTATLSIALRALYGELAAIGPVLLFLTGILFGAEEAEQPVASTLALLAVLLLWILWRRWYRRRESLRLLATRTTDEAGATVEAVPESGLLGARSLVAALVIMAVAGTAAVGASAIAAPPGDRDVLRTAIEQPFDPREHVSPLSSYRRYLQPEWSDETVMTVRGLPLDARIRIATLDSYDGVVFAVGSETVDSDAGQFSRVPYRVDQSDLAGERIRYSVEIGSYEGVWVPTIGQLEAIDFEGDASGELRESFYYNDTTGTAAEVDGLSRGDGYTVEAVLPDQPGEPQLRTATPGAAAVPAVQSVPDELTAVLDELTAGAESPGERLLAMLDGLRETGYVSSGLREGEQPSRSGHSTDRITEFLTDQVLVGDAEQYAVTAALMARELGFPARVVFGFAPEAASDAAEAVEVVGDDVSAWIEVHTAQHGWVSLDPVPEEREIPEELPEEPATVSRPQSIVDPPRAEPPVPDQQTPPQIDQEQPDALDPLLALLLAIARVVGLLLLIALVLALPFILVVLAKVRRRGLRRTRGTPRERIVNAWEEYEDAVLDHGIDPGPSATRSEIASLVGGTQPHVLAAIADRAAFAPEEPNDSDAATVWRAVRELRAALDAPLTRRARLRALISLRSLGLSAPVLRLPRRGRAVATR